MYEKSENLLLLLLLVEWSLILLVRWDCADPLWFRGLAVFFVLAMLFSCNCCCLEVLSPEVSCRLALRSTVLGRLQSSVLLGVGPDSGVIISYGSF